MRRDVQLLPERVAEAHEHADQELWIAFVQNAQRFAEAGAIVADDL